MKPTVISLAVTSLLAPLAMLHAADPPKPQDHPNIILIYIDDLGYGDIGVKKPGPGVRPPGRVKQPVGLYLSENESGAVPAPAQ